MDVAGCRSLRGNVDRNLYQDHAPAPWCSRSLRGNVDRNLPMIPNKTIRNKVVPYVGTWIEMLLHLAKT